MSGDADLHHRGSGNGGAAVVPRLALSGIVKRYPGVVANDGIALQVAPGEIHAVLGENGAGKSTLMKIIYGVVRPDAGELRIDGERVQISSPRAARAMGLAMVFQHFSLFESLDVAENVWLGLDRSEPLAVLRERIAAVSADYGLSVDPAKPVHALSVGERQRVEIVRALLGKPRVLILDEPTSVLTPQAVQGLFQVLRRLAAEGCSILYISHKLDEIRALCHGCTVLRGGRVTGAVDPRTASAADLSRLMIGREPPALQRTGSQPGPTVLAVADLHLPAAEVHGTPLRGIGFELRAGEVLGVAGVSGNGQQALMMALSGEDTRAAAGSIRLFGQDVARLGPARRRAMGLHAVPEERLGRGAVPSMSLALNTLLTRSSGPWVRGRTLRALAERLIRRFEVKAAGPDAAARSLSGGNLQKYIVGREIDAAPKVLLVSQPTWGVDVGAAGLIRAELLRLRDAGCAVLVVSEELDELFALSDRLVVIAQGRLSPAMPTREATVEILGQWMSGLWPGADPGANPGLGAGEAQGGGATSASGSSREASPC